MFLWAGLEYADGHVRLRCVTVCIPAGQNKSVSSCQHSGITEIKHMRVKDVDILIGTADLAHSD